ncbi:MAG TPA: hypothetical protein PKE49_16770 [Leptospiraceae bacterium]|nr:hypothetical protein [Leptospirales bacterium]HMU82048.1 hypothetical protein [Leptospiraceae bacterium]HMW61079.1 hypothetical protein [Leptospiraceae bacterium]HMX58180.1 hypothetical protein [Leptospiraceae bacterium]HMY44583.1 hypothetical protein [Leptospiraceae bacterium]
MIRTLFFAAAAFFLSGPLSAESVPTGTESPLRVFVSAIVSQIGKVNDQAGNFEMTVDLQLRWRDPRLKFDAREHGSDRKAFLGDEAEAETKEIWTPQLVIRNMNGSPIRLEQAITIQSDGTVVHLQRIKASFDTKFRLQAFPFDKQELPVRLISNKFNSNQIVLTQDQTDKDTSGIKQGVGVSGFHLQKIAFSPGRERGLNGEYFPTMDARVQIARDPTSHIFTLFAPFLALLVIPTVLTLFAKVDVAPRLTAWSASILALIALNFTFSIRYPAVGADGLINSVVSTGFGYQLLMVFISLIVLYPPVAEKITAKLGNKYVIAEVEKFMKWGIPVGLFALLISSVLLTMYTT